MSNIIPPPELVREWGQEADHNEHIFFQIAARASQWGADRELEACCEWVAQFNYDDYRYQDDLCAARRQKPPSLKKQALDELRISFDMGYFNVGATDTIRRALEALPE